MPHDHLTLKQAPNGELGVTCHSCDLRMTFGQAMVVDQFYYCWQHYVELTGAASATASDAREQPFYRA